MICSVKIEEAFYGERKVLEDIDFKVDEGGILAIVGESGAGKTTLGRIISGLYRFYPLRYSGTIELNATVDVIPQNITDSLDPIFTIKEQMLEIDSNLERIKNTLEIVGLDNVNEILCSYPHNLSGGMKQRVLTAMALLRAHLLLADEFTSALDMITKLKVVGLLKKLNREKGVSIIFITHDMELLDFEGDMIVMFDGKVLEKGRIEEVKALPLHPYTHFLINSTPKLDMHYTRQRFEEINIDRKFACPFVESCEKAGEICKKEKPGLKQIGGRWVRCHF